MGIGVRNVVRAIGKGEILHMKLINEGFNKKEKWKKQLLKGLGVWFGFCLVLSTLPQVLNISSWEQISPQKQFLVDPFFFMEQFDSIYTKGLPFANEEIG